MVARTLLTKSHNKRSQRAKRREGMASHKGGVYGGCDNFALTGRSEQII